MKWEELDQLMKDPDFRERNGKTIARALSPRATPQTTTNATRGRENRASGQSFEDQITAVLDVLWVQGHAMVFNTGPKVVHVGKGEIKFKQQSHGRFIPPMNPPDYMGHVFGIPVAFDAKVSHSSTTYYATRQKKQTQHDGIVSLAKGLGIDALVGYVIQWDLQKISFIHALDVVDGKVRQSLSRFTDMTVEGVFRQWAEETGHSWPVT